MTIPAAKNLKSISAKSTMHEGEPVEKDSFVTIDGFGRIPFIDAPLPQALLINDSDIRSAVCEDPRKCVLAQSCRRSFGNKIAEVIIYRTVAHVIFLQDDGTYLSWRYALSPELVKAVSQFDARRGWNIPVGVYMFNVMSKTAQAGARGNRRDRVAKTSNGRTGQQKGIMQAVTRRLLAADRTYLA